MKSTKKDTTSSHFSKPSVCSTKLWLAGLIFHAIAGFQGPAFAQTKELRSMTNEEVLAKAKTGDADAAYQCGIRARYGPGVYSLESAKYWLMRAAEWGNKVAMALCLGNGWGRAKDREAAYKVIDKVAPALTQVADSEAARVKGMFLMLGWGCKRDSEQAFMWYKVAAAMGNSAASYGLADFYFKGEGCPKDPANGVAILEMAVKAENTLAMIGLGTCYGNGIGVSKDLSKANEFYQKAGECGNGVGYNNLGIKYEKGIGVAKSLPKAIEFYQRGCELGSGEACCNLGVSYQNGSGVPKNLTKANELYLKAGDLGEGRGYSNLGLNYAAGNGVFRDLAKAKDFYQKAGDLGDEIALAWLAANNDSNDELNEGARIPGMAESGSDSASRKKLAAEERKIYENDRVYREATDKRISRMVDVFRESVDSGLAGDRRAKEFGMKTRYDEKLKELRSAIENEFAKHPAEVDRFKASADVVQFAGERKLQNDARIEQLDILTRGDDFQVGRGVKRSLVKSNELYKKAGDLGCGMAYFNLGVSYWNGDGVPKSLAKAHEFYQKAGDLGYSKGYVLAGLNCELGTGVIKDATRACDFYEKAAKLGSEEANKCLKRLGKKPVQ